MPMMSAQFLSKLPSNRASISWTSLSRCCRYNVVIWAFFARRTLRIIVILLLLISRVYSLHVYSFKLSDKPYELKIKNIMPSVAELLLMHSSTWANSFLSWQLLLIIICSSYQEESFRGGVYTIRSQKPIIGRNQNGKGVGWRRKEIRCMDRVTVGFPSGSHRWMTSGN